MLIHPMLKLILERYQRIDLRRGGLVGPDELGLAKHLSIQQVLMLQGPAIQPTPRLLHTGQFSLPFR